MVPHVQTLLCPPRRRLSRSARRHRSARRVRRLPGPPPGGEGCIPPGWPGTPRTSEKSGCILRGHGGDRGTNSVTAQGGHPFRHHRHDGRGRWLPHRPRRPVARQLLMTARAASRSAGLVPGAMKSRPALRTWLARELRLNPCHSLTIGGAADAPGHRMMARPGMLPPCC